MYNEPPAPGTTPTCDNAGVLASIIHIIASIQASEALKILSGHSDDLLSGITYVDVWHGDYRQFKVQSSPLSDCEACGQNNYVYLDAAKGSYATNLCGRNAVQISWREKYAVDFKTIAENMEKSGEVSYNDFLLKFSNPEVKITLFPDGRAIIEGTEDGERARELYAKFVG